MSSRSFTFSFLLVLAATISSFAQTPAVRSVITYGDSISTDYARDMVKTQEGDLILAGDTDVQIDLDPGSGTQMMNTGGFLNPFIQKLNPQGSLIWAKSWSHSNRCYMRRVDVTNNGDIFITCKFEGTSFDADPSSSFYYVYGVSSNQYTPCLIKLNSNGHFQWAVAYKGGGLKFQSPPATGPNGSVTMALNFTDSIDVNTNVFLDSMVYAQTPGKADMLVQRFDNQGVLT